MSADTAAEPARESRRAGPVVGFLRWLENLSDTQYAYLLLTPVFVLLGIVAIYPLLRTFELSLYAVSTDLSSATFVGARNYVALFTGDKNRYLPGGTTFLPERIVIDDPNTRLSHDHLRRVSVLFETLIGFGQALILDQDFRGRRWVRVAIIIPWAVPIVIQGMIWYLMFQPNIGFLVGTSENPGCSHRRTLNDTAARVHHHRRRRVEDLGVHGASHPRGDAEHRPVVYDVAKVAGASRWQQFKLITFPLILPTIGVAVLFRSVQAMRVYGIIDTVSSCTVVPSLSCMVVARSTPARGRPRPSRSCGRDYRYRLRKHRRGRGGRDLTWLRQPTLRSSRATDRYSAGPRAPFRTPKKCTGRCSTWP